MMQKQRWQFSKFWMTTLSTFIFLLMLEMISQDFVNAQSHIHYINWNTTNPLFKEYGNNIIDIDAGTEDQPWRYEQANIICPRYSAPNSKAEMYIIYNVTKTEFDHCQVINPQQNKIVAVCNTPYQLTFFTLTFRAFSPVPGAFEFHPGENYYFISTSSKRNLHKHRGGRCATHNMRLVFRISDMKRGDNKTNNVHHIQHNGDPPRPLFSGIQKISASENTEAMKMGEIDSNYYDDLETEHSNSAGNSPSIFCDNYYSFILLILSKIVLRNIS